jgi:multiple sugar transport system substrate-binding protein
MVGGETFGAALGFDSLVLYYNTDKFQSAGLSEPPLTWNDLIEYAQKLVVQDPRTGIQVGGVAMGTANNVDHWSDIVGLLLMQNGSDPSVEIPVEVLEFYTQFVGSLGVWDSTLPNSTYAFATEKVAMIFGPSWRAHEVRAINPNLEFRTAPLPQISGNAPVAWASYWLEGVSRRSANTDEAWKFLAFLSNNDNLAKLYTTAAQSSPERRFGEPYPKTSMMSSLQSDPVVGSVVSQGSYAQSWYLCSRTYDDGLNDGMIKYFEDAINAINRGSSASQVLPTLTSGINQKLQQFGISGSAGYQQEVTPQETSETAP